MARYTHAFGAHGRHRQPGAAHRRRPDAPQPAPNALRALDRLLDLGVVPVVNENDTVATARDPVRRQRPARGARGPPGPRRRAGAALRRRLPLRRPARARRQADPAGGRARSDLDGVDHRRAPARPGSAPAAWSPRSRRPPSPPGPGIPALVTSTANAAAALAGKDVGTWFSVNGSRKPVRLLWLAHLASVQARLRARRRRGQGRARPPHLAAAGRDHRRARARSRPATRSRWSSPDGTVIARGLVELRRRRTSADAGPLHHGAGAALGRGYDREVVHR